MTVSLNLFRAASQEKDACRSLDCASDQKCVHTITVLLNNPQTSTDVNHADRRIKEK